MSKEKLYFKDTDDNLCKSLESRLEDAQDEGLEEITLIEAIPDNSNNEYVWCMKFEAVEEEEYCNKDLCRDYCSKSGRGKCQYRGKLYLHGKEFTFKVPQADR